MFKFIVLFSLILQPCFAYQTHQNVYFAFDEAEDFLDSMDLKNFNGKDVFLIQGYADPTGDEYYNRLLSRARARAVKQRLISEYGIKESQIKITFYGEDHSVNRSNAQKRRAEITTGTASEIAALMKNSNSKVTSTRKKIVQPIAVKTNTYEEERVVSSNADNQEVQETEVNSLKDQSYTKEENFVVKKESEKSDYQDRYYVGLGVYNNILLAGDRGTGNEAEWVSGENYNLEAQYQFKYKNFWLGVQGSYHKQDYEVELNPTFTWDESTPNLLRLSLVSDYETNRWGLGFDLDYHQTSFVYEQDFDVELRDIFMLGVSLRAKYKWLETQKWSSRLGLKLDLPLSGSDEISPKGELGYIGFVDLRRDKLFRDYGLNVKLYYGFRNYTNNQNDQEEEVAGLLFSLTSFNWL